MSDFTSPLVSNVFNKITSLTGDIGKVALASLYPDDFELYLLSLELVSVDENDKETVIRFFSFPVMPNSISYTEPQLNNVKKTMSGVSVVGTQSYLIKDLQIQGNFGRNFRIILNNNAVSFNSISTGVLGDIKGAALWIKDNYLNDKSDTLSTDAPQLSTFIKNGYGSTKILQKIIEKAKQTDNGRSRKLYLHLPALGKSYLVKPTNFNLSQNMSTNMMWGYNLSFKIIGEVKTISKKNLKSSLVNKVGVMVAQKAMRKTATQIQNKINQSLIRVGEASINATEKSVNRNFLGIKKGASRFMKNNFNL